MTVKRVDLSDTGIGLDGLRYILEMLDENTVITDIVSNDPYYVTTPMQYTATIFRQSAWSKTTKNMQFYYFNKVS